MAEEQTITLKGKVIATAQDVISNFAGVYFDIINEHSINIQNQITDNYLENNTAVQDHIAHSPVIVTLSGLAGELIYVPTHDDNVAAMKTALETTKRPDGWKNKLTTIDFILPPVTNAMQVARNAYDYVEASVNRYIGIAASFINFNNPKDNLYGEPAERDSRLEQIYSNLIALRTNNTAFRVTTPYKEFDNMYIQSLSLRQGNENYVGDISITFKQLRFTEVKTTDPDKKVMGKYNAYARASEQNNGKALGEKKSLAAEAWDKGTKKI